MQAPPRDVCIVRLSSIGDVCHALAVVRALQRLWPETRFTWVIGHVEAKLVGGIPDIEFVQLRKSAGLRGLAAVRRALGNRRFDRLLLMQLSFRANLVSALARARRRLGYPRSRERELHGWFVRERIAEAPVTHVLDVLMGFAHACGAPPASPRWDLPITDDARAYARSVIPDDAPPTLVISPCSSHALRNWRAERYARVAEHAVRKHGWRVVLCGGPSPVEREMGRAIAADAAVPLVNTIGEDTLVELAAVLERATLLVSPDSGPAHIGTAVGTPVLGLYACTDPHRSGPYHSIALSVNRHPEAAERFLDRPAASLRWGTKIEQPGVMDLIEVDDVIERLDAFVAGRYTRDTTEPVT